MSSEAPAAASGSAAVVAGASNGSPEAVMTGGGCLTSRVLADRIVETAAAATRQQEGPVVRVESIFSGVFGGPPTMTTHELSVVGCPMGSSTVTMLLVRTMQCSRDIIRSDLGSPVSLPFNEENLRLCAELMSMELPAMRKYWKYVSLYVPIPC